MKDLMTLLLTTYYLLLTTGRGEGFIDLGGSKELAALAPR